MNSVSQVALIAGCGLAILLAGCAGGVQNGSSVTSTGGRTDKVTESDEPDIRRRARLRLELASSYFQDGQLNVALDEIKQAINTDPSYGDAHNLRGMVYMQLKDVPLAEESFRRALALNPRDGDAAHNYAWLLCQQSRLPESLQLFNQAINTPTYTGQAKSLMSQGVCLVRAGQPVQAEASLLRSYELDAGNPVTAYNLANLLYQRSELTRAQFYMRRLNSSDLANAETLWLGIRIEQRLGNREAVLQLGDQLRRRYPQSREAGTYERGMFNE